MTNSGRRFGSSTAISYSIGFCERNWVALDIGNSSVEAIPRRHSTPGEDGERLVKRTHSLQKVLGIPGLVDVLWLWQLDGRRCHICGKTIAFEDILLDHVVPKAAAGQGEATLAEIDRLLNLRVAHKGCNSRRSDGRIPGQPRLC